MTRREEGGEENAYELLQRRGGRALRSNPHTSARLWRYGVALFPLPVFASVGAAAGFRFFVADSIDGPSAESGVVSTLAALGLSTALSLVGVVAALVVLVALILDARALRRTDAAFASRPAFAGVVGAVHLLASAAFAPLYVASVPALAYYTDRRFQ